MGSIKEKKIDYVALSGSWVVLTLILLVIVRLVMIKVCANIVVTMTLLTDQINTLFDYLRTIESYKVEEKGANSDTK